MSNEPKVTRFGADPTVAQELATKAYVDAVPGSGPSFIAGGFHANVAMTIDSLFGLGLVQFVSVEANIQTPFSNACTLRRMSINILSSTTDANTDFRLRINGTNGNQIIVIPSATTGVFQDLVNTDSISSGDLVNYLFEILASANSLIIISSMLEVIT